MLVIKEIKDMQVFNSIELCLAKSSSTCVD